MDLYVFRSWCDKCLDHYRVFSLSILKKCFAGMMATLLLTSPTSPYQNNVSDHPVGDVGPWMSSIHWGHSQI